MLWRGGKKLYKADIERKTDLMEQGKSNLHMNQASDKTWKYSTYYRNNIYYTSEYLQMYPRFFFLLPMETEDK